MFRRQLLGWLGVSCAVLAAVGGAKAEEPYQAGFLQLGTSQDDLSNGVSADGLGNVYISGSTGGSLGGPNAGDSDAYVALWLLPG